MTREQAKRYTLHGGCVSTMSGPPPTWRDRLRWKLFPAQHCDLPQAPPTFQDVLVSNTTICLSFIDRIRLLISGRLMLSSKAVTENTIGGHAVGSVAFVLPPKFMERKD